MILSVRSLTALEENIVATVLAKLVPLFFFLSVLAFFFLYHYGNENVSVTLLSLICITSILSTIYPLKIVSFMVNLAVITALTHSGSFGDIFVKY